MRGHHNTFPLIVDETKVNNGALSWWSSWTTTQDLFDKMHDLLPTNGVIQANHPIGSSGLFESAGYDTVQGVINKPNFWSAEFDAMELINDGSYQRYLPYYLDLISRGQNVIPVSVSDSHSHTGGVGLNRTYIFSEGDSEEQILNGMQQRRVIPSAGPYVHVTINDEFAPGQSFVGSQDILVEVYNPSWMDIDTLELYENGEVVQTVEYVDESVVFTVDPTEDAHYSVTASGTFPMLPLYNSSPWSISAALYIDVEGDGWTSPKAGLQ